MIDFCKLNWIWRYDILFKNIIFIAIRKQTKSKIALFSSKCLNDKPNRFFSSIVLIQRHGNWQKSLAISLHRFMRNLFIFMFSMLCMCRWVEQNKFQFCQPCLIPFEFLLQMVLPLQRLWFNIRKQFLA